MTRKHLMIAALAAPLLFTAGCATRSSVELAQTSANTADAHALDARSHADAAQTSANSAQARADQAHANAATAQARAEQAAGIGSGAQTLAQSNADRVATLEGQLTKVNARIAYLQRHAMLRKVVYKKPVKHKTVKAKPKPKPPTETPTPTNS
jgi:hypothetical protein